MNTHSPQRALQNYFDDLLTTGDASVPAHSALRSQPAEPVLQPQRTPAPPVKLADYEDEQLVALEQSKREKLQALLNSKPLTAAPAADAEPVTKAPVEAAPVAVAPEAEAVVSPAVAPPVAAEEPRALATETDALVSRYLSWHENGRPHWAQQRFDALLFDVAGLTLAVPLIALGQIQPLTDELTPLFGQADWFMGLMPTPTGRIRTVNTALFVMPEKYDPAFLQTAKYVVSIDGVPWGLAVDAINQPVSLDPDDVKWRSERTKRPWLAGTVKSAMCALIDIPQMGQMLMDADKNSPTC